MGIFSGALTKYNGIGNLIKAMEYLQNKNFKLKIYGSGSLEEYVINATKLNDKIEYLGNVPNSEMIAIQQSAGILLNPRIIDDPVSLYTFPSKMIEYLLSGTPVATTKLNGLTKEYLENVFVIEKDTPIGIAETIDIILNSSKEELIEKSNNARAFIVENKNWEVHCREIEAFIK